MPQKVWYETLAETDKIPKIDPAEVELLIEKFEQNRLSDQDKRVITGLLRTLLYLVGMLQDKKATLLRLREMIFGRKSEKRKKADPDSAQDEEKKDAAGDTDNGTAKDQAGIEKNEKSESEAGGAKRRGHGRLPLRRIFVDAGQLVLKLRGEDLVTMASQKEKELGALDDFVFRRRGLNRRLPRGWSHNQIAS